MKKRIKICFACCAGGHLNQLKELIEPMSKIYDIFFITLDRLDARSILINQKKYFVPDHQKSLIKIISNIWISSRVLIKENPDVIITNGGGAVFPICLIAKIFKKKIIFIESFARIETPSKFGRWIYPISDLVLFQWRSLNKYYKKGKYLGPIFNKVADSSIKKKQIFITVGTIDNDFSRLIKKVDEIASSLKNYEIVAQIGKSKYIPENISYFSFASYQKMLKLFSQSEIVITHGGSGSIINALNYNSKVIVVPRYKKFNEHVDDHQIQISKKFEKLGTVLVAYEIENLLSLIKKKKKFQFKNFQYKSIYFNTIKKFIDVMKK